MKIALVNDVAGVASAEARLLQLAGHDTDVLPVPALGASWSSVLKWIVSPVRLAGYLPLLRRLRSNGYDIAHIHFLSQGFIGLLLGLPYYLHAHGSDVHLNYRYAPLRAISWVAARRAQRIFFVTANLGPFLAEFGERAELLPDPVSERFRPLEAHTGLVRRILVFMRLDPVKGASEAIAAAAVLAERYEVLAIDWGPLAPVLTARYGDRVRFIDRVPPDRTPEILHSVDLVIGQLAQGVLGLSEVEALMAARPVIMRLDPDAYPEDPPPVVPATCAAEIVTHVDALASDPERVRALSAASVDWAQRVHGEAKHLERLLAAYGAAVPSRKETR